jgi:hypothetical protein
MSLSCIIRFLKKRSLVRQKSLRHGIKTINVRYRKTPTHFSVGAPAYEKMRTKAGMSAVFLNTSEEDLCTEVVPTESKRKPWLPNILLSDDYLHGRHIFDSPRWLQTFSSSHVF